MPNEPGVNTVSPPANQDQPLSDSTVSSPVNVDVVSPDSDRPEKNLKAEFDRKYEKLAERLDELVALVAKPATPPPAEPTEKTYTDDELYQLWQQGYQQAGDMLIERKMNRHLAKDATARTESQIVNSQLGVLFGKYPMLSDASHPLTKTALAAKKALIASGKTDTRQTELEAILLAIADNPGLALSSAPDPDETPAVVPSTTPRRSVAGRPKEPQMDPRALAAAQRMGVKDPAGARKRFYERNAKGASSVSPLVAQIIEEE